MTKKWQDSRIRAVSAALKIGPIDPDLVIDVSVVGPEMLYLTLCGLGVRVTKREKRGIYVW
jgi:hypothetical protein